MSILKNKETLHGEAESNVISLAEVKEEKGAHPRPMWKDPPIGDWLSRMKTWTEFAFRDPLGKHFPRWCVQDFKHLGLHISGNVLLCPTRELNNTKSWVWVDPVEFCKTFEFRGIIHEPTEEELTPLE